jgi:hypothetical protein
MKHQLFKILVPLECLFTLLQNICNTEDEIYIIDDNAYKKLLYHGYDKSFLEQIISYYHTSKQHYVTRTLTYNSFVNIVRQICHSHSHDIIQSKKYNHSVYTMRYIIKKDHLREHMVQY